MELPTSGVCPLIESAVSTEILWKRHPKVVWTIAIRGLICLLRVVTIPRHKPIEEAWKNFVSDDGLD